MPVFGRSAAGLIGDQTMPQTTNRFSLRELSDHTALGFWSFSDEMAWRVDLLRDDPADEPFSMVFIDVPLGDIGRTDLIETLYARAGLTSYQELVADHCQWAGEQARDQVGGEG